MSPGELGWLAAVVCAALAVGVHLRMRARLELVARADHELRGPLTAARLALHGLDRAERVPARVAALDLELCRATLAAEDLAAARSGRRASGRVEVVDVHALLRDAEPAWTELAGLFGADLAFSGGGLGTVLVCLDRLRLAQAIANLIANAAEQAGGLVGVSVSCARGRVRIEVADDGPGLPQPVAELARGARGGRGGRGRGLAIALAAAQDAGGSLTTAPSSSGARLMLELPAVGAAAFVDREPR